MKYIFAILAFIGILLAGGDSQTMTFKDQIIVNIGGFILFAMSMWALVKIHNKQERRKK